VVESENPSAGKFGPPPENAKRERVRQGGTSKTPKSVWPAVLVAAIFALQYFSRSHRGWGGALAVLLAAAAYGAEFIFYRQQREADDDGHAPFSPPTNITR